MLSPPYPSFLQGCLFDADVLLNAVIGLTTRVATLVLHSVEEAAGESTELRSNCEFLAARLAIIDEFIRSGHSTLVGDIPAAKAREVMTAWRSAGASQILSEDLISGRERGVLLSAFLLQLAVLMDETARLVDLVSKLPPPSSLNSTPAAAEQG